MSQLLLIEINCKNYTNFEKSEKVVMVIFIKLKIKKQIVMLQLKKLIKQNIMN